MRKLVLFGLLGAIFGFALALEHVFSKQEKPREVAANQAVFTIGGGPPRVIPETPPAAELASDDEHGRASSRSGRSLQKDDPVPTPRPSVTPAPTPTPAPPPTPTAKFHVVEKGETLSQIAHDELGSSTKWKELARWNGLADASKLVLGSKLRLAPADDALHEVESKQPTPPSNSDHGSTADAKRTHKVEKGETLSKIAAHYLGDATRWREIQRLNKIADPASVGEGATLELPER